jgi:protein ImuA
MLHDLRHRVAPTDPLTLASRRMHEAGGRGRRAFALFQAARHSGPVVWIVPDHIPERPLLAGLPQGLGERLILLTPKGQTDLLWSVEEALRASPVGLVIAEPQAALSLTEGRRLQLAAEAGGTTGIMLIREGDGCNSTETRWNCEPFAGKADSTLHQWSLTKNKKGTLSAWMVNWNGATTAFHLVSEVGERHEPAKAPG